MKPLRSAASISQPGQTERDDMASVKLQGVRAVAVALLYAVGLGGCAAVQPPMGPTTADLPRPDQIAMLPAGDVSTVTRRTPPSGGAEVLCISPSPDWATSLAVSRSLTASGGVAGGPSASAGVAVSDSQTVAQLAGRTAGVVALRDGLHQACLAYANGQIGRSAYALILSQYGDILIQLVGAGAAAGAAAPPATGAGAAASMQQGHVQALLVACLNAYDRTLPSLGEDPVLQQETCRTIVKAMSSRIADLLTPDRGGGGSAPAPPAAPKPRSAADCVAGRPARGVAEAEYRGVLRGGGFYADAPGGTSSRSAMAVALALYQAANGLCPSGVADAETLRKMKLMP